jgi:MerR family transcriptional regulator, light-induced transcriptional regulator
MKRQPRGLEQDVMAGCQSASRADGQDWASVQLGTGLGGSDGVDRQRSDLAQIIAARVIPRLLLAHVQETRPAKSGGLNGFKSPVPMLRPDLKIDTHVDEFADLITNRDGAVATKYFEAMINGGAPVEALFQELLAPAARRLGELWDEDINTMFDVTQGLAHLQQIVRTFSPDFQKQSASGMDNRRALLMPMPGENHVFGITLVEQFFRREGWHVWGGPPATMAETVVLVGSMWFDVAGFSVSRVPEPKKLAKDIAIIRKAARNRKIAIMIGGAAFLEDKELYARVGADATAIDGAQAVMQLNSMIGKPVLI